MTNNISLFFITISIIMIVGTLYGMNDTNAAAQKRRSANIQLGNAVIAGDIKEMQRAIERGASIEYYGYVIKYKRNSFENHHGNTPLHTASLNNAYEAVQSLLIKGAEVSALNDYGSTPLFSIALQEAYYNDSEYKPLIDLLIAYSDSTDVQACFAALSMTKLYSVKLSLSPAKLIRDAFVERHATILQVFRKGGACSILPIDIRHLIREYAVGKEIPFQKYAYVTPIIVDCFHGSALKNFEE